MMVRATRLFEDFGKTPAAGTEVSEGSDQRALDAALGVDPNDHDSIFEQGYKAGWDDATTSLEESRERIRADLEDNIRDLGFTYAEARTKMLSSMEPLVRELVETVLPRAAHETLGVRIMEEMRKGLQDHCNVPVTVKVAPTARAFVEDLLPQSPEVPITVIEAPFLAEGQVQMAVGKTESFIDLTGLLDEMSQQVAGFFELHEGEQAHG